MKNTGLQIDDVIEAATGVRPDMTDLKDPLLQQMRDEMGQARRENQITDEKEWLEQLARFRETAEQPRPFPKKAEAVKA
jgi:hypothetical protein